MRLDRSPPHALNRSTLVSLPFNTSPLHATSPGNTVHTAPDAGRNRTVRFNVPLTERNSRSKHHSLGPQASRDAPRAVGVAITTLTSSCRCSAALPSRRGPVASPEAGERCARRFYRATRFPARTARRRSRRKKVGAKFDRCYLTQFHPRASASGLRTSRSSEIRSIPSSFSH